MLPISVVVEVNGLDSDVRLKGDFVKQDSATCIMCNVEVIRGALVLKVLAREQSRAISTQCVLQWLPNIHLTSP